jgi:hypothetical protein
MPVVPVVAGVVCLDAVQLHRTALMRWTYRRTSSQRIPWELTVEVKVEVTLWLVVYCQSVHLGTKPLDLESELLYDWWCTANQLILAPSPLRLKPSNYFFPLNTCGHGPYVTSSLTRGWVCHLQLQSFLGLSPVALMIKFYCLTASKNSSIVEWHVKLAAAEQWPRYCWRRSVL